MFNFMRKVFSPPVIENDEAKSRTAVYLNPILWVSLTLLIILRVIDYISYPEIRTVLFFVNPISILVIIIATLLVVMRAGFIREASFILLIAAWLTLTYSANYHGGIFDTAFICNFILIMLAGLLLDSRASLFFTVLAILTGWGLAYFQTNSVTPGPIDTPYVAARDTTAILILFSLVSYLTINGLRNALKHSSANAAELQKSNVQLQTLSVDLEKRVEERTLELQRRSSELEAISNRFQRRAIQLQAVAQVGRAITSMQSLESLLPRVAAVIAKQFEIYHVGIFMLDDAGEFAILSAANSPDGHKMIEQGYRLPVGTGGSVGYAARIGQPRATANTDADTLYVNNLGLPNMCSELALPLKISSEIIGVLDLQSENPSAFGRQDIELLTIVADQVAIAIQNARRFQETQKSSLETETLYGDSVRKQWVAYTRERDNAGYRYSGTTVKPLLQKAEGPNISQAVLSKVPSTNQENTRSQLAVPIQLRGQVIGILNIEFPGKRNWDQDEIDITQSIADRVALAIENARLLQDAQSRAAKERVIGDIAAKLSTSNNMDSIFQTAAQELGLVMPDAEVVVQFLPDQNYDD